MPSPVYLTLQEAADLLAVSRRTVQRRVHEGRLPAQRVGKGPRARLRFRKADVKALLTEISPVDH